MKWNEQKRTEKKPNTKQIFESKVSSGIRRPTLTFSWNIRSFSKYDMVEFRFASIVILAIVVAKCWCCWQKWSSKRQAIHTRTHIWKRTLCSFRRCDESTVTSNLVYVSHMYIKNTCVSVMTIVTQSERERERATELQKPNVNTQNLALYEFNRILCACM